MTIPKRWQIVGNPIVFKAETEVQDHSTGNIYRGEFRFSPDSAYPEIDRENHKVTFNLPEDSSDVWELVIFDEEEPLNKK
jgi:hypothetical protein